MDEMLRLLAEWGAAQKILADHHFWPRIRGENQYCRARYFGDEQAALPRKLYDRESEVNRYTAVNYSYNTHGTIEIRVLPMFETVNLAISAFKEVIAITNAFLVSQSRKEQAETVSIQANMESGPEEGLTICA